MLGERLLNPGAHLSGKDLNYLLGWVVMGFFLLLMFSYLSWKISAIADSSLAGVPAAEEWHLSQDPVYRDDAAYISAHGIFHWLPRGIGAMAQTKRATLQGGSFRLF